MKRWGSFLLVIATIQLYAQDEPVKIKADSATQGSESMAIQELKKLPDPLLLDESSQAISQEQEVAVGDAPALASSGETSIEDLKESADENLVAQDDSVLVGDSQSDSPSSGTQELEIVAASTNQPEEVISPEQTEIIEVVQQPVVQQQVVEQPVAEESAVEEPEAEESLEGEVQIDSSPTSVAASLPPGWEQAQKPGNYQKKALIFKQAGDVYDKIRAVEPSILQVRESFFSQKTTLNTNISEFFYEVGATQTEIAQQIDDLMQKFDEEELEDNELLEEERELVLELNQNKSDLNVLKQNIISLTDVSASLDSGLAQLDSLLSKVQGYEDSGWQLYQQIDEIFDDVQAADLLGQMQMIQENAEALIAYTQGTFSQFFNSSTSMINTQMAQIKSTLTSLQARGVAIVQEEEQFDADEAARQEAQEQALAEEAAAKQVKKSATWQSKIQKYFSTTRQWAKDSALSVYDKLFGVSAESVPTQESVNEKQESVGQDNAQAVGAEPVVTPQEEAVKSEEEETVSTVTLLPSIQVQPLPKPPEEIIATDAQ